MAEEPTATSPTTSRPARKQRKAGEKKVDMLFQRFMKAQKTNEDWKNQGNNFVWIPDDEKAYVVGEIVDKKGDEVLVQLENGTRKTLKQADTEPMNPPNLTKINDMAQLSYLNDASVLNNLRMRYEDDQIYTYSGLFLVAINPYKRLPIYSQETIDSLKGRRREECPPHIFAVADTAFRQMTQNHTDQSMLVTGESGAGKTENTKKIIQYLTSTASKGGVGKLEQQLLRTNPLLEAFGNAKTVRNNNSSRFGKFIQIDFGASYYIVGTKIQNYLLETTRVVAQNSEERNFHFFYQLCANPEPRQKYFLGDPRNFKYLNQSGCYTVTGVDDEKEFTETINAMSIIGLSEDEREEICAISAALLHLGNIEFTKVSAAGKDGAEIKDKTSLQHAAKFLGVEASALEVAIIHPTITAGTQVIKTHASPEQASANRNALARSIYDKMFNYIVSRINESLSSKEPPKNFIGVLDIAGFEIFETNSFEQLCINYTNERLQQFFNHHMFKKEQDEYMKEQIEWQMQDFGMDLQPTIDIIEKPNGIMATIDELAVIPGSNEKTLTAEVLKRCGPGSNFLPKGAPAIVKAEKFSSIQFTVSHYAGEVKYTTTRWIEKNTDPLSEDLKTCMRASKRKYLNKFFQPTAEERQMAAQRRGRMTISIQYRTQLKNLMTLLGGTEPHFIRCIVPNSLQKPGIIDPFNVLHQLKCNGVLEGIRIVKKGYPGRLVFKEFEKRYSLLSKKAELAGEPTSRGKCILILQSAGLVETKHYKIGQTKVFMKAGVEASLEEAREARLSQIMITVQAAMRGWLGRKDYETLKAKIAYIKILQKNWKTYYNLRDWSWWQLYQKARPEIERRQEEERRKKEREALEKLKQELKEEQENISKITQDKNSINSKIATLQVNLAASKNKQDLLQQDIKTLQGKISELEGSLRIIKDEKRLVEEDKGKFGSLLVSRDATIKQKEEEAAKLDEVLRTTTRDVDAIKKNIGEKDLKGAQSDAKLKHVEEEIKNWKQKFEGESTRAKEIDRQKTAADDKIRELNAFIDMLGRQKQELENKNRQLGEDIKTKRNEIGELQSKLNLTNEEANTVKLELSKKENELKNKVKSLEDTGLDKKKSDSELVAANEKLNDEIRKRQKVETDLRHVVGDNAELDQKIQRLKEEIKNLENLIGKQRDENTQQKEKVNELSESNAQLENKRAQLERALREASLKANEDRDNDKQTINKLNTKLTDQTNDFNDQNAQLTQQRNQVDNKVRNLEKQQRDTQKQFGDLQKSKEDTEAKIKKLEGEVQDLNNQLAAERRRGSDIEDAKKNVQAEIRNNNLVIDQFKEDSAKLDTKFRKAQQELTDAQEKSSTLETERDDLLRTIDTQDRNTRQTKADLDAAKNQLNQIQVEKEKTANEVRNLSQRAIDLENQIQTLQNAQKGKGEEGSTIASELEKVSADRKNLQRKVTQLEGQQKTLQAKLEEITKKLQEENAKREQAESKLRDAETRLLAAKGAVDDATRRLKNLEQQIATAQNELNDASNNLNRLKVERRDVQAKVDEHQEQVGALEGAIESANSQIKTLQGKLNEVTSKLESEKQNRANVELETGRLRGELDRQKEAQDAESRKQKAAVEDLNQQLNAGETAFDKNSKNLQDEISDLKKELSRLQLVQPVNTVDQEAVERLRRDYEAQIVKLTAQRDEELKACNDLESRTKQQETILQDARDKLEFEEKQRKKAEMQKRQLADDLEEYREQAEEAEELREDLEKSQQEGKQAVTALKGELEKIRNQRMASEEALQSIKRENDNLKTQLEAERNKDTNSSKVKSQFESELSELENLVNKAKRDKANTQKLLKKLERENRELTGKIAEQSQNKMDSDNKFSTKERELQKLKADYEFQSKIVVRYESENKGLSSEVNKFKEMCTKLEEEASNIRSQIQRQQKKSREMERRARSATSRRGGAAGDDDDDDL